MRVFTRSTTGLTADSDGLVAAATLAGAGDLTLLAAAASLDPPRRIVITSAGDDSGITFTIEGRDRAGNALSETLTGANASSVTSNYVYSSVTKISASGASADDVEVGWSAEVISPWVFLGNRSRNYRVGYQVSVSGTVNVDVEQTFRNILRERLVGDYDETVTDVVTADTDGAVGELEPVPVAVRLVHNSGSGTATLRVVPSATG